MWDSPECCVDLILISKYINLYIQWIFNNVFMYTLSVLVHIINYVVKKTSWHGDALLTTGLCEYDKIRWALQYIPRICTPFCCALLCCGYVIVHDEFTWVFIHIHQGCLAGTGAIVRLPQCQWSKPDGYGKSSQCITTTKHSKAKTVCIFLGIYCISCEDTPVTSGCPFERDRNARLWCYGCCQPEQGDR